MSTRVEKTVTVNVPVSRAYNQWTQFEDFPQFMDGVQSVTQLSDDRLAWVVQIAGVRREWEARILEQVPDQKVAWAATEGATNAGAVTFEDIGGDQTSVTLVLDYEPEGVVEKVGDALNVVERRAEGDLERFKTFIESEGYATGAWRGSVGTPGAAGTPSTEDADASRGDSGKAGVSPKAVAAGVGVAAVAAATVAAVSGGSEESTEKSAPDSVPDVPVQREAAPAPESYGDVHMLTNSEVDQGATIDPEDDVTTDLGADDLSRLGRDDDATGLGRDDLTTGVGRDDLIDPDGGETGRR